MRKTSLTFVAAVACVAASLAVSPAGSAATFGNGRVPEWYRPNLGVSAAGDVVAGIMSGRLKSIASPATPRGCRAEPSPLGNVQVNCRAEDGLSPRNTQSETSIVAVGDKVVVGYNDSFVCCNPMVDLSGYSVSTDGGKHFVDRAVLPWQRTVQPTGDPSLARDSAGNIYYATLAFGVHGTVSDSLIAVYVMPVGATTFRLLSIPVNVGDQSIFFADKELLEIGQDGSGHDHFYMAWTNYAHSFVQGPVTLSDSTDGINWRTTRVSSPTTCAPTTPGGHPVPAGSVLYVSWEQFVPKACSSPSSTVTKGNHMVAVLDSVTAHIIRIVRVAPQHGAGDVVVPCGFAALEVIETQAGHDSRLFDAPASTIDSNGTVYFVWNDRPHGPGGGNTNATRIYLSYSRDGAKTWNGPYIISGALASGIMNDRYQPAVVADASGLHATWYERVLNPNGGADLLREDKENLTLATSTSPPMSLGEQPLSTVPFPIYKTNPQQDPVIALCYMGDYNQVTSNGNSRFASWGDNRYIVTTTLGTTENEPNVFSDSF